MDEKRFEDFVKRTENDLDHIKDRVNKLWDFRVLLLGGSFVISTLCSAAVAMISVYYYLGFVK